jgi:glucuronate isomerase
MSFLDDHYLLTSSAARELYDGVRDLPIIDPHNHADVAEIVRNQPWSDIWQVEGATDHYVWELMRRRGVSEENITGSASNFDKWKALAGRFPEFAGNPTYEWIHLDLRRRFGIDRVISSHTAEEIWEETSAALAAPRMRPQSLLDEMRVEIMCTTDDPTLSLPFHEEARRTVRTTRILPTWRPDKAMNIEAPGWKSFVSRLGSRAGEDVSTLSGLLAALARSHAYFGELGCVAADHGLAEPVSRFVPESTAADCLKTAWDGATLLPEEIRDFKAFMLQRFGEFSRDAGWVMQLHVGPVRDFRTTLQRDLGPDSGGDISSHFIELAENLRYFLNEFDGRLKIVLYCVDPSHLSTFATLARAFPNVTLGAPWWWNDSPYGMETQLKYIATVDLLANHAGMVTDSRKLISFGSRTEMFRRILCEVLGGMIVRGQIPESAASDLARRLSFDRPRELFFG